MAIKSEKKQTNKKSQHNLWNSDELEQALGVNIPPDIHINKVNIDTRNIEKDDLFIALKGDRHNGNFYALDALKKGAKLCIVDEYPEGYEKHKGQLIKVDSAYDALVKLAKYARKRVSGKVVGITGSYGKTTTKELLKVALENQGLIHITEKNFNNEIGLPLSIANMPRETDYGVFEMGACAEGEIRDLTNIATPDIAIVTEVGPAHLETFHSISATASAKSEIFEGVAADGIAIINNDNIYRQILINKAKGLKLNISTFGRIEKSDFWLLDYSEKNGRAKIVAECKGRDYRFELPVAEPHIALYAVAVLGAVHAVGGELEFATREFQRFESVSGRGDVIENKTKGWKVVNDCYNANPITTMSALDCLKNKVKDSKRKVAVLGHMVELGKDSAQMHADLSLSIIKNKIDKVFCVGKHMDHLYNRLPEELRGGHYETSEKFANIAQDFMRRGDAILVKGSRVNAMESIVKALTK